MVEEKIDEGSIEEINESCTEEKKTIRKNRLIKTAKTSTKIIAVFIVALFLLNGLAVAQSTSIDVDVNKLPYDNTFSIDQEVTLNLMNVNGKTTLLVKFDGVSAEAADINVYLNGDSIGTIEKGTANLFIITITGGSSLRFYALAGMHVRVEKVEGSMVYCPSNAKISGELFYKIWNECYVAEINLPSNKIHHVTLISEKDITYMGITEDSISSYGVASNTKIALPENTNLKLVSNTSVKFNLRIEEQETFVKRSLTEQTTVVGINIRSQSDPTNFNNIMIENIEPEMLKWSSESYANIPREWVQNSTIKYDPTFSWKTNTKPDKQEYYDDMDDAIISPPIPLNVSSNPTLSFWTKYELEGSQWVFVGYPILLDREFGLPMLLTNSVDADTPGSYILNISATEVYTYDNISFGVASSDAIDNVTWYFGDGSIGYGVLVNHSYMDDGNYTAYCVIDGDGGYAKFPIEITVLNRPPIPVIDAYRLINVTLRVAGKKGNTVTMTLLEDNVSVGQTSVTRQAGNPDEQSKTITLKVRGNKTYQALLQYDGSNGGSNPVKLISALEENDDECEDEEIEINLNSADGEYQEQTININSALEELLEDNTMIVFNASESYDIDGFITDYVWGFGDETTGTGMVVSHMYAVHGVYNVTLNVTDDDYATNETMIPVELSLPTLLIDQHNGVSILPPPIIDRDYERLRRDWDRVIWRNPPRLVLKHYDNIWVEISTDNSSWNALSYYPGTGVKNSSNIVVDGWVKKEISLSSYVGGTVWVRFRMVSDPCAVFSGGYVDEIKIGAPTPEKDILLGCKRTAFSTATNNEYTLKITNNGDIDDDFIVETSNPSVTLDGTGNSLKLHINAHDSKFVSVSIPTETVSIDNPYDIDNDGILNADEFNMWWNYDTINTKDYFESNATMIDPVVYGELKDGNVSLKLEEKLPETYSATSKIGIATQKTIETSIVDDGKLREYIDGVVLHHNNSQIKLKINIADTGCYKFIIDGTALINTTSSLLSQLLNITLVNNNKYSNQHSLLWQNSTYNVAKYENTYIFSSYLEAGEHEIIISMNNQTFDPNKLLVLALNNITVERQGINPLNASTDGDNVLSDYDKYLAKLSLFKNDTDNDGFLDSAEKVYWVGRGLDQENISKNLRTFDVDNDGLPDGNEVNVYNTTPSNPDTDNDGYKGNFDDGAEVKYWESRGLVLDDIIKNLNTFDADNDTLSDGVEVSTHLYFRKYHLDPAINDSDNDGLSDSEEIYLYRTYVNDSDSDDDGLNDKEELNLWNSIYNTGTKDWMIDMHPDMSPAEIRELLSPTGDYDGDNLTNIMDWDSDNDGLHDGKEFDYGTNLTNPDCDNDGLPDGWEVNNGFDAADADNSSQDPDTDSLTNIQEYATGTDPFNNDTDNDGLDDDEEAEVIFRTNAIGGNYNPGDVWVVLDYNNDGVLEACGRGPTYAPDEFLSSLQKLPTTTTEGYSIYTSYRIDETLVIDIPGDYNPGYLKDHCAANYAELSSKPTVVYNREGKELYLYNPINPDTDEDGIPDGWEVSYNLNPKNPNDASDSVRGEVFSDNFDDGVADGWDQISGSWAVENGQYSINLAAGYGITLIGQLVTDDLEIQIDFLSQSITPGNIYNGFIIFDYKSDNDFKYAGRESSSSRWVIGSYDGCWNHKQTVDELIIRSYWIKIRVVIQGNKVTLYGTDNDGNEKEKANYTFDLIRRGSVGLAGKLGTGGYSNKGYFDNVIISDLFTNFQEYQAGTDPTVWDTDMDGMPDGWEVKYGLNGTYEGDAEGDPDNDTLSNIGEYLNGTNPRNWDTDSDGMADGWEVFYGLDPLNRGDNSDDSDNDTLTNLEEYLIHTNPANWDSDSDGMPDGYETRYNFNPLYTADGEGDDDEDGVSNFDEYNYSKPCYWDESIDGVWWGGTKPTNNDTDQDGLNDSSEINPNVFWYEAEDYGNNAISDDNASGGEAVINQTGDSNIYNITQSVTPSESYKYYVKAKAASLFSDDFESGDMGKWTSVESGWSIVTDVVHSGKYAAKGVDTSTTGSPQLVKDIEDVSSGVYEGWFRFGENNSYHYPVIFPTTSNGADLYAVVAKSDKQFGYYDKGAGTYKNYPVDTTYSGNTWYHLRFKWDSGTFWVWINNELVTPDGITVAAYDGNSWTGISKIRLLPSAGSYTGTMWVDDIKVYRCTDLELEYQDLTTHLCDLSGDYQWYNTTSFIIPSGTSTITLSASDISSTTPGVIVDKVMLVKFADTTVNSLEDGSTVKNLTFDKSGNQTVNISIQISGDVPRYVTSAKMELSGELWLGDASGFGLYTGCWGGAWGVNYLAQTFKPAESFYLSKFALPLFKEGIPPDVLTIEIRKLDASGKPDLSVEALICSSTVDESELPPPAYSVEWTERSVPGLPLLKANVGYCILAKSEGCNFDNRPRWRYDTDDPYPGGMLKRSWDSGSTWEDSPDLDLIFKMYGYPTNPYLNLGDNNGTLAGGIQWGWFGGFYNTSTTLDLAGEINKYIANNTDLIDANGYINIPLKFHSDTAGILKITNISIVLGPKVSDPLCADTDSDGLLDGVEVNQYNTNPLRWDSDNDFISDCEEVSIDQDIMEPGAQYTDPADSDSNNDGFLDDLNDPHPTILDYDHDGLSNGLEWFLHTNSDNPDSDGDYLLDGYNIVVDKSSMTTDEWNSRYQGWIDTDNIIHYVEGTTYTFLGELSLGTKPTSDDTDGDGLEDGEEVSMYHTSPLLRDTDGDELIDSDEACVIDNFEYDDSPENHGWSVYAGSGSMSTVYDNEIYSRVLNTSTDNDPTTSFGIRLPSSSEFTSHPDYVNLHVDIKDTDGFVFYVRVKADDGNDYYIQYDSYDGSTHINEYGGIKYIHRRIGEIYQDGVWHIIDRNLQDDLNLQGEDYTYDVTINSNLNFEYVKWFCIRGDYRLDNLCLYTTYPTDPNSPDTDFDNMPDKWEIDNSLNPTVFDAYDDPDNDELPNVDEYIHHTIPTGTDGWDSDNDDMPDAWEVRHDLDPTAYNPSQDYDHDGMSNYEEYVYNLPDGWTFTTHGIWWNGTNPREWDTDGDGLSDKDEIYNWYNYELIQAEYYFGNSVVFNEDYFITSDMRAVHLKDKSLEIPIEIRWSGSYKFSLLARSNDSGDLTINVNGNEETRYSLSEDWTKYVLLKIDDFTANDYTIILTVTGNVQIDYILIEKLGLDPLNPDTDNDGLYDGYDITDEFGNTIKGELSHNCYPLSPDSDRDAKLDGEEVRNNQNPNPPHALRIPTYLFIPSSGAGIYSSMIEQIPLYVFIMTVTTEISGSKKDVYGANILSQGIQAFVVPYDTIYQLQMSQPSYTTIPYVLLDSTNYTTSVNVTLPDESKHQSNITVFTFTITGEDAVNFVSALLKYSNASRITNELDILPSAIQEIIPWIEPTPDHHSIWGSVSNFVGEKIVKGGQKAVSVTKTVARTVVNVVTGKTDFTTATETLVSAGSVVLGSVVELGVKVGEIVVDTGKKVINSVQDGIVYLEEVRVTIIETAWNYRDVSVSKIVNFVLTNIEPFKDWVVEKITEGFKIIVDGITNAIQGWFSGIHRSENDLWDALAKLSDGATMEEVNEVTERFVKYLFSFVGLQNYVDRLADLLRWAQMLSLWGQLNYLSDILVDVIRDRFGDQSQYLPGGVNNAINGFKSKLEDSAASQGIDVGLYSLVDLFVSNSGLQGVVEGYTAQAGTDNGIDWDKLQEAMVRILIAGAAFGVIGSACGIAWAWLGDAGIVTVNEKWTAVAEAHDPHVVMALGLVISIIGLCLSVIPLFTSNWPIETIATIGGAMTSYLGCILCLATGNEVCAIVGFVMLEISVGALIIGVLDEVGVFDFLAAHSEVPDSASFLVHPPINANYVFGNPVALAVNTYGRENLIDGIGNYAAYTGVSWVQGFFDSYPTLTGGG